MKKHEKTHILKIMFLGVFLGFLENKKRWKNKILEQKENKKKAHLIPSFPLSLASSRDFTGLRPALNPDPAFSLTQRSQSAGARRVAHLGLHLERWLGGHDEGVYAFFNIKLGLEYFTLEPPDRFYRCAGFAL